MTNYIFKELRPREDKVYKCPEKLRMILDYNFNAYLMITGYEIITKKKKKCWDWITYKCPKSWLSLLSIIIIIEKQCTSGCGQGLEFVRCLTNMKYLQIPMRKFYCLPHECWTWTNKEIIYY